MGGVLYKGDLCLSNMKCLDQPVWPEETEEILPIVGGRPVKGYLANSADPDQTLQNAASDRGLHCLQIV